MSVCCLITCTCLCKNILCSNYGSSANYHAWGFIMLQFPFISQSSPRATFWLMSTPIQYKINWFHSRRLEMVGNISSSFLAIVCIILNQQNTHKKKKKIGYSFSKVELPTATWSNTDSKNHADTSL